MDKLLLKNSLHSRKTDVGLKSIDKYLGKKVALKSSNYLRKQNEGINRK